MAMVYFDPQSEQIRNKKHISSESNKNQTIKRAVITVTYISYNTYTSVMKMYNLCRSLLEKTC